MFLRDGEMSNVKWQVKQSCDYLPFDALVGVHLLDEESRIPTCAAICHTLKLIAKCESKCRGQCLSHLFVLWCSWISLWAISATRPGASSPALAASTRCSPSWRRTSLESRCLRSCSRSCEYSFLFPGSMTAAVPQSRSCSCLVQLLWGTLLKGLSGFPTDLSSALYVLLMCLSDCQC